MTRPGLQRIGWWLALEPMTPDSFAWSLIRADGTPPDGPAGAGLRTGVGSVRELAAQLLPGQAAPADSEELWTGPLVDPEAERWCSVRLGRRLLPPVLREELLAADPSVVRHTVTVACRGWLAQVPWEALALDTTGDVRLVERARVGAGLSPTINAGRRRAPRPRPDAPALRVIDPGPRQDDDHKPLYPGGYPACWDTDEVLGPGEDLVGDGAPLDAAGFGAMLASPGGWSRLLYFGHVLAGTMQTPAAASLVFRTAQGIDRLSAHAWLSRPDSWPAPARVALIACGSDDSRFMEQSGLPVAAVNAGAELLTVTRWTLPLDVDPPHEAATTALALAIDSAHRKDDPLGAVQEWQIDQLARWRAGGRRENSPLLWGAVTTYLVPQASVEPAPAAGTGDTHAEP